MYNKNIRIASHQSKLYKENDFLEWKNFYEELDVLRWHDLAQIHYQMERLMKVMDREQKIKYKELVEHRIKIILEKLN